MGGLDLVKYKLKEYTKAYYGLRAGRGFLLWIAICLAAFLFVSLAEYWFRFEPGARRLLFYGYLALFGLWLALRVMVPLLRMMSWIKGLGYREVAQQIGRKQKGLDDKIINTLDLSEFINREDNALALAAIEQKANELKQIDFKAFVDRASLKKMLLYALIPTALILLFSLSEGGREVLNSSRRVVMYNEDFRPPAPFEFIIDKDLYKVESGKDLSISLKIEGEVLPDQVQAKVGALEIPLRKEGPGEWRLDLEQVTQDQDLVFSALNYDSKVLRVRVLESPAVSALRLRVVPPKYTGLETQELNLAPELRFAEGSQLEFMAVGLRATKELLLMDEGKSYGFEDQTLDLKLRKDLNYDLIAKGVELEKTLLKAARIRVIKDQKPEIAVIYQKDSLLPNSFWARMDFQDDYGFTRLERHIEAGNWKQVDVLELGDIYDRLSLDTLAKRGADLRVFYRIWDNDAVNGPKYSDSPSMTIDVLSEEEKEQNLNARLQDFRKTLQEQRSERASFQESLKEINRSFNEQKNLAWQERQEIKELLKRLRDNQEKVAAQKEKLEEDLKELKAEPEQKKEVEKRLDEMKQEDDQLKKLREEIEKLMEDLDLNKMQEKLQELQEENKQQLRREDRLEDMLKDLMFQRDLLKETQRLKDLAEQLKKMSQSAEEQNSEALEDVKKQMEKSSEKLSEMAEDNKQLKDKIESSEFQGNKDKAKEELQKAQQELSKSDKSSAQQSEEEASENMEELSESLMSLMASMQKQALEVNMESLRRILENLKQFSKDVESSGLEISDLGRQDPRFRDLLREQSRLMAGSKVIEDSLVVLSEKAPQVKETVFKELAEMQGALAKAQKELQEQGKAKASTEHQYSMMAANNLALLLDESLQNMMSMMAQKQKGNQNCEKPGNGKPKPGQMSEKLSQMGKKVQKLEKGSQDGKGKEGQGKEMAEILAEQEALREMLMEMEEGSAGSMGNKAKMLEDLDKMEDAVLDKDFSAFKERFKRIETRMLESEKALEERKQKEEREAERAEDKRMKQGEQIPKQFKEQEPGLDRYRLRGLKLNEFYYELGRR